MNIREEELYKQKYLKYKKKYLEAKQTAGKPIVKEDLRPGENQLIGLVTNISHPWYEVRTNHETYKVKLRPGVTRKIKKNGSEEEHRIVKGETLVILLPEVCSFGKDRCGDIVKIYSPKEKEWLLLNETLLLGEQFLTEPLYHGERDLQHERQKIEFVHSKSQQRERTIRPGGKEYPPSESEEDEDDPNMHEVVMKHSSKVFDPESSSDEEFYVKPELKPEPKQKHDRFSQRLHLELPSELKGKNPYLPNQERSGAADATYKWGQHRAADTTRPWAQHRAADTTRPWAQHPTINSSRPSAASSWDKPHAADPSRDWARLRAPRDAPEPESTSD